MLQSPSTRRSASEPTHWSWISPSTWASGSVKLATRRPPRTSPLLHVGARRGTKPMCWPSVSKPRSRAGPLTVVVYGIEHHTERCANTLRVPRLQVIFEECFHGTIRIGRTSNGVARRPYDPTVRHSGGGVCTQERLSSQVAMSLTLLSPCCWRSARFRLLRLQPQQIPLPSDQMRWPLGVSLPVPLPSVPFPVINRSA